MAERVKREKENEWYREREGGRLAKKGGDDEEQSEFFLRSMWAAYTEKYIFDLFYNSPHQQNITSVYKNLTEGL